MEVPATLFSDADNTLWDTNAVYATAQLQLLALVEKATGATVPFESDRLAFLRAVDQAIAQKHHAGLAYPTRLLVRATAFALKEQEVATAARRAWSNERGGLTSETAEQIAEQFEDTVSKVPDLRPGVRNGLRLLRDGKCPVVVITEGARTRALQLLSLHGLRPLARVIQARKDGRLFRRVRSLKSTGDRAYMVGDQLDRDIAPAKAAGLITIYFPGGFRPRWAPDASVVRPDFEVSSFEEVARIVLRAM